MLGTAEQPGMIPLTVHQLFSSAEALESQGWKFDIVGSAVEIYNESFRDLLATGPIPEGKKYSVREHIVCAQQRFCIST